ncbi:PREDICTED: transmembrane protein 81 [Elephantulus edwardii]|uniref:transmembrane protein 81 n=1 Tax=Elephantulus edwardii TaxID=28737 RepID=UPI0003F0F13B|nr:PREDICTED: transmembrane protein 81 [Elephantulus edwardii]
MKKLATSLIFGSLMLASHLPFVVTLPKPLDIPEKLQEAVGTVIVSATACTVTCGLGYKEETVCEVGPDGVRRKCKFQRLECLTNWMCGMLHFTIPMGKEFELSCLSSDILEVGQEAFWFTWRLARGIISTDDELFKPFRTNTHSVKFESASEFDAGTYRCDVQMLKNLKLVKRLYYGLRVLPPHLVNLNFDQSLTEDQKLVDEGLEVNLDNYSRPLRPTWKKHVASALAIGLASGVAGGVMVSIALYSGLRMIHSDNTLNGLKTLCLKD